MAYLAGGSYVAAGLDVLAKTRSRDKVFLRASRSMRRLARLGGARSGVRARSSVQLGRRRFPMRQDQAPVAVAEARGRRRGERPSRGGSLRARRVRGGRPRHCCGSRPERAAPRQGLAGRRRDDRRLDRRQSELVDELDLRPTPSADCSGASALDDANPPAPKGAAASSSARQGPPTLTV